MFWFHFFLANTSENSVHCCVSALLFGESILNALFVRSSKLPSLNFCKTRLFIQNFKLDPLFILSARSSTCTDINLFDLDVLRAYFNWVQSVWGFVCVFVRTCAQPACAVVCVLRPMVTLLIIMETSCSGNRMQHEELMDTCRVCVPGQGLGRQVGNYPF